MGSSSSSSSSSKSTCTEDASRYQAIVLRKCFSRCRKLVDGSMHANRYMESSSFPDKVLCPTEKDSVLQPSNFPSRVSRARDNLTRVTSTLARVASNSSRHSASVSQDEIESSDDSLEMRGSRILS